MFKCWNVVLYSVWDDIQCVFQHKCVYAWFKLVADILFHETKGSLMTNANEFPILTIIGSLEDLVLSFCSYCPYLIMCFIWGP